VLIFQELITLINSLHLFSTLRWLKYASKYSLSFIFHIYINCVWWFLTQII